MNTKRLGLVKGFFVVGMIICLVFIYLTSTKKIVNKKGRIGGPFIEYIKGGK